jgi:hypothetical protein
MTAPAYIRFDGYQPPASVHNQAAEVFQNALVRCLGETVRFEPEGNIVAPGHPAADLLPESRAPSVQDHLRTLAGSYTFLLVLTLPIPW